MKKILIVAAMLTGLSFASIANEVKDNEGKKTENSTQITPPSNCYAGQTTCGTTYMACTEAVLSSEDQLQINDIQSNLDCGTPMP